MTEDEALTKVVSDYQDKIRSLTAENSKLKEALKPFADGMEYLEIQFSDAVVVIRIRDFPLMYGDFRRARSAYHTSDDRSEIQ